MSGPCRKEIKPMPGLPDDGLPIPLDIPFRIENECDDGSKVYVFDVDAHVKCLIANLRCLWKHNQLTDTMLMSEERKTFRYHSVLLATCSPVFRTWFSGTHMQFYRGTLAPRNVSSHMMKALQDYLYNPENVLEYGGDRDSLYTFATHFELEDMAVSGILDTRKFLANLGEMYSSRSMAFGVLSVDSMELPCHYALVAAAMPYLRPYLTKTDSAKDKGDFLYGSLPVENADPDAMIILLDYLYYAKIEIREETMFGLLMTATKMRVLSVAKACCDYIQSVLNVSNVLDCYYQSLEASQIEGDAFCKALKETSVAFIVENFHQVIKQEAFLNISEESQIIHFLSIADLSTIPFAELIEVIQEWCSYEPERNESLPGLLSLLTILKNPGHFVQVLQVAGKSSKNQVVALILAALKGKPPPKTSTKKDPRQEQRTAGPGNSATARANQLSMEQAKQGLAQNRDTLGGLLQQNSQQRI